jgi:bifunctional DNase/RNase
MLSSLESGGARSAAMMSRLYSRSPALRHSALALGFAAALGCSSPAGPGASALAMNVRGVQIDPRTESPIVLLEEAQGEHRRLPIWIGPYEAQSIASALARQEAPRPNTHDLIKSIFEGIEGTIERVVITELREGTYYAVIEAAVDGRRVSVDARPSDAIAVAVRIGAPVFASESVLGQASSVGESERALEIGLPAGEGREPAPTRSH